KPGYPLAPCRPQGVKASKYTEGSLLLQGLDKFQRLRSGPCRELDSFDGVFCDFAQVVFAPGIAHMNDAAEATGGFLPGRGKLKFINESGLNKCVEMQVPAVSFVGHFERIKTANPISAELGAP